MTSNCSRRWVWWMSDEFKISDSNRSSLAGQTMAGTQVTEGDWSPWPLVTFFIGARIVLQCIGAVVSWWPLVIFFISPPPPPLIRTQRCTDARFAFWKPLLELFIIVVMSIIKIYTSYIIKILLSMHGVIFSGRVVLRVSCLWFGVGRGIPWVRTTQGREKRWGEGGRARIASPPSKLWKRLL